MRRHSFVLVELKVLEKPLLWTKELACMRNSLKRTALRHLPVLENAKVSKYVSSFLWKEKILCFFNGKKVLCAAPAPKEVRRGLPL